MPTSLSTHGEKTVNYPLGTQKKGDHLPPNGSLETVKETDPLSPGYYELSQPHISSGV